MKVHPSDEGLKDIVEIRPKRKLRIRRINEKQRDEALQKELKVFLDNLRNVATTPRVVTVPKFYTNRKTVEVTNGALSGRAEKQNNSEQLPNSTHSPLECDIAKKTNLTVANITAKSMESEERVRPLSNKEGTDLHSESRASILSHGERSVMSSSAVQFAFEKEKPSTAHSIIAETDEPLSERSSRSITMHNGLPPSHYTPRKQSNQNDDSKEKLSTTIPQSASSPRKSVTASKVSNTNSNKSDNIDKDIVIFFIHGVGGSSDIWKSQMEFFQKLGVEIISVDLIGHGLSDAPDKESAYTFNEILNDTTEIFDNFCKRKNVLVGHSYGCAFATVIARERRKWVSKLVLVSGGGPTPLAPQPGVFSLPLCLLACCRPCINTGFHRGAFHPDFKSASERQKAFDVPTYVLSYVMNGQFWLDGDDLYHSWISTPTLLVYGRHDKLVSLQEEEEMLKTIYGSHLEIVEDAGHMLMMETPEKFNQLLYNFITDQPFTSESLLPESQRPETDDENFHITHRSMGKSQVSLHSVRSHRSTSKSMPHGLLSTSMKT